MVDVTSYLVETRDTKQTRSRSGAYSFRGPLDSSDLRSPMSDCQCLNCKRMPKEAKFKNVFEDYHRISLKDHSEFKLPLHAYLLCPNYIPAFVFRTRRWGVLFVLICS